MNSKISSHEYRKRIVLRDGYVAMDWKWESPQTGAVWASFPVAVVAHKKDWIWLHFLHIPILWDACVYIFSYDVTDNAYERSSRWLVGD